MGVNMLTGASTEIVSALTTTAGEITSTITGVAPVALGVVGIGLAWRYGIRFFKSLSKA